MRDFSEEIHEIRERQAACEARLESLERSTGEVVSELKRLSELLRGNGDRGLFVEVGILDERIEILRRQWKWIIGLLAGLVAAVAQALLRH